MRNRTTPETGRSQQVRQRRNQSSKERLKRASKPVRYAAEAPTVFVRGGFGTPVVRRTQSKVRRQVTVPLDSPGAEILLPSLPMVRIGWRLMSGFLVIVLTAMIYLLYSRPEFQVGLPQVEGVKRLSVNDIEAVAELEGTPVFMVNPGQTEQALMDAFPELKEATVKLVLPATVVVTVTERKPVLAWSYNSQTLWMDKEGAIFPARGEVGKKVVTVNADGLPPLDPASLLKNAEMQEGLAETGSVLLAPEEVSLSHSQVDPAMLNGILALSQQVPPETSLVFNNREGMGWTDPRGWNVYIGRSLDNLDEKLAVYNKVIEEVNQKQVQPVVISVAQVHAPYYRLEL